MIGQLVNRVCDVFDKPSDKEPSAMTVDALSKVVTYGFYAMMILLAYLLVNALYYSGLLGFILTFLLPIGDEVFSTIGNFFLHYALIGVYVLLVMAAKK